MQLGLKEDFGQLGQLKHDVGALLWWKRAEPLLHGGIDEERFFQELSSDWSANE